MNDWLKSWLGPLLLILGAVLCGLWWIGVFTEVRTTSLTIERKNLPDTTILVAPVYTKYSVVNGDTMYIFYDKKKNPVVKYSTEKKETIILKPIK